jgi:hypothetical protein
MPNYAQTTKISPQISRLCWVSSPNAMATTHSPNTTPRKSPCAKADIYLRSGSWPITTSILVHGGELECDLPTSDAPTPAQRTIDHSKAQSGDDPLKKFGNTQRERQNLLAVLERIDWEINGEQGVTKYLMVMPVTLQTRIKNCGLKRAESTSIGQRTLESVREVDYPCGIRGGLVSKWPKRPALPMEATLQSCRGAGGRL